LRRFADVTDVVHETLKELAPPLAARLRFLAPPSRRPRVGDSAAAAGCADG
jgi:hypothetical protein